MRLFEWSKGGWQLGEVPGMQLGYFWAGGGLAEGGEAGDRAESFREKSERDIRALREDSLA